MGGVSCRRARLPCHFPRYPSQRRRKFRRPYQAPCLVARPRRRGALGWKTRLHARKMKMEDESKVRAHTCAEDVGTARSGRDNHTAIERTLDPFKLRCREHSTGRCDPAQCLKFANGSYGMDIWLDG